MVSIVKVDNLTGATGTTVTIPAGQTITNSGTATGFPAAGGIGQIKQAIKLDTQSVSSATTTDITGLQVAITPSATSSKIMIYSVGSHWGDDTHFSVVRGSTEIGLPATAGSRTLTQSGGCHRIVHDLAHWNISYLDSPNTTSAITYKVRLKNALGGGVTAYINRTSGDSNDINGERAISSITVIEVLSGAL